MRSLPASVILLAVLAAGCQRSPFVPVSGRVTLDGVPVEGATVLFQPVATEANAVANGSIAKTGPNGEFALRVIGQSQDGAVPGKHHVTISAPIYPEDGSVPDLIPDRVPAIYHRDGGIEFEVPAEGTVVAGFDLVSTKKSGARAK